MSQGPTQPAARTSGLVVKTVGDEVLVYDLETHRAHSVNRVAVAVWRRCDGTRDAARIAADLREDGVVPVTEEAVQYALGELGRARLLTGPVATAGLTRREVMRRLGTAAAVALPAVTTIIAPTAAQAQSCGGLNAACDSVGAPCPTCPPCCPGLICSGGDCVGT